MRFDSVAQLAQSGWRPHVVIVGSGPAGLSIALRLQQHKLSSLLVEAGGWDHSAASQEFYKGRVIGDPYFPLQAARLRQFGGTSGHWSGWCRPLDAIDFEPRAGIAHYGWPIRKHDLEPYAAATAALLGVRPIVADRALTPQLDEIEIVQTDPVRFGTVYREHVERAPSIGLLLNTAVKEIVAGNGGVTHISVVDAEGREQRLPVPRLCVCTGGIENSRLLLWSNLRQQGGVVPHAATLGRYWMEHPAMAVADVVLTDEGARRLGNRRFFVPSPVALRNSGAGTARIWLPWLTRDSSYSKELMRQALCVAPGLSGRMLALAGQELRCGAWLRMDFEQLPRPDNRIVLGRDTDPLGVPRVDLHWRKTDAERKTVLTAARLFGEALIAHNLGRLRLRDWLLDGAPWPDTDEPGGFHHMGGTRMAEAPSDGVVDRDCKVFGMDNLYVGGSSVFPCGSHANPTFTIVQLGLRLGDHLAAAVARG